MSFEIESHPPAHYGLTAQNVTQQVSTWPDAAWAGMEVAAEQGRRGLGTVFVAGAGNGRVAWYQDGGGTLRAMRISMSRSP